MNVREVMTATIISVQEETSFKATAQAMLTNRVSCLPVMDSDGHLVGIVSESDLLPKESQDGGLFGTASEVAETPKQWDLFANTRKSLALTARDLMSHPV
ncbi:MAG TPA: CBS domain-containing protein, partial [Isosphaeraceae bacterium]|nr:CBS domain-containing protein [Isosphaeraceae bacterium]